MKIEKTPIEGLLVLIPDVFEDGRGYFYESWSEEKFRGYGIDARFVQDNQSFSRRGVLRGLHFQREPYSQGKLVRVTKGKVLDVAVDLRKESETFGEWFSIVLGEENKKMLWIPERFAHGFLALEDVIFQYKVTNLYNKESDTGIRWNDPDLCVDWQLEKYDINPIVSEKDANLPFFKKVIS
jgi:dTDP-4-dehydrorhamnose 3,5-epimerase